MLKAVVVFLLVLGRQIAPIASNMPLKKMTHLLTSLLKRSQCSWSCDNLAEFENSPFLGWFHHKIPFIYF